MVERQLICRDIKDARVIEAFTIVDREDYIQPRYKKYSYADIEIPINLSESFILRPYFLASIVSKIIEINPTKILVVGDLSGYTTAILKNIHDFETISATEQEILDGFEGKFDIVYLDAKIYQQSVINQLRSLLNKEGCLIYMAFTNYDHFMIQKFAWHNINVLSKTHAGVISKLFSWKIFLKEN